MRGASGGRQHENRDPEIVMVPGGTGTNAVELVRGIAAARGA
jgi:hypothetical protein